MTDDAPIDGGPRAPATHRQIDDLRAELDSRHLALDREDNELATRLKASEESERRVSRFRDEARAERDRARANVANQATRLTDLVEEVAAAKADLRDALEDRDRYREAVITHLFDGNESTREDFTEDPEEIERQIRESAQAWSSEIERANKAEHERDEADTYAVELRSERDTAQRERDELRASIGSLDTVRTSDAKHFEGKAKTAHKRGTTDARKELIAVVEAWYATPVSERTSGEQLLFRLRTSPVKAEPDLDTLRKTVDEMGGPHRADLDDCNCLRCQLDALRDAKRDLLRPESMSENTRAMVEATPPSVAEILRQERDELLCAAADGLELKGEERDHGRVVHALREHFEHCV